MKLSVARTAFVTLGLCLATSAPAFAGGSVAGGLYTETGNGASATGPGIMLGTTSAMPLLPATIGLTGFLPLARGGGYAATVDGTFSFVNNAIGIGYGIGQFGAGHSGGTATAFLDHKIGPLTSLELRAYRTMGAYGAAAGFVGLKFSL
ncbi:MAG TPA: hypothetical protein VMF11_08680 [Candidatus Baltobacteraceae bacterium]|nr:hypothetical protein [Candidatus Baltobacteraceae bacterium]